MSRFYLSYHARRDDTGSKLLLPIISDIPINEVFSSYFVLEIGGSFGHSLRSNEPINSNRGDFLCSHKTAANKSKKKFKNIKKIKRSHNSKNHGISLFLVESTIFSKVAFGCSK